MKHRLRVRTKVYPSCPSDNIGTVFVVRQLVDVIWLLVIVVGAASGGAIWIVALAQDRGCFSWAVGETEVSLDGGDDIVGREFVRE